TAWLPAEPDSAAPATVGRKPRGQSCHPDAHPIPSLAAPVFQLGARTAGGTRGIAAIGTVAGGRRLLVLHAVASSVVPEAADLVEVAVAGVADEALKVRAASLRRLAAVAVATDLRAHARALAQARVRRRAARCEIRGRQGRVLPAGVAIRSAVHRTAPLGAAVA